MNVARQMRFKGWHQAGFGFLGLMLVVVVLAAAGSLVMMTFDSSISNQALNETVKKMDRLIAAIEAYQTDAGAAPTNLTYLFSDVGSVGCSENTASSKIEGWCGPYLEVVFSEDANDFVTDGWNTAFDYDSTGTLTSWGPNKTDDSGGGDDITRTF